MTIDDVKEKLGKCKTFYDELLFIKETDGLRMVQDNGWFWLEYNGEEVEGTADEKFTEPSEMNDLMRLAGVLK